MNRFKKITTVAVVTFLAIPLLAQIPGVPQAVIDVAAIPNWAAQLARIAAQIKQDLVTYQSIRNQELWMTQIFSGKAGWQTPLTMALNTVARNSYGETQPWNPALSTGIGGNVAWQNASVNLQPTAPLLSGSPLGTDQMAQLATIEAMDGLGANNLNAIGGARSFMQINAQQMQSLQNMIADSSAGNNSPTQQMQLVASASGQGMNIATQNLMVATATLETQTVTAKALSDAAKSNLNMQTAAAITRQTDPVAVGGFGAAFASHP